MHLRNRNRRSLHPRKALNGASCVTVTSDGKNVYTTPMTAVPLPALTANLCDSRAQADVRADLVRSPSPPSSRRVREVR
jgi:hypothetical protein